MLKDNKSAKVMSQGPQGFAMFAAFIGAAVYFVQHSDQSTELTIPLATTKSKDIADEHHGVTLGCPAGRVGIDELRHSPERGLHATNNLIDYLVETIIEEAHMRGHLAVSNYVK